MYMNYFVKNATFQEYNCALISLSVFAIGTKQFSNGRSL